MVLKNLIREKRWTGKTLLWLHDFRKILKIQKIIIRDTTWIFQYPERKYEFMHWDTSTFPRCKKAWMNNSILRVSLRSSTSEPNAKPEVLHWGPNQAERKREEERTRYVGNQLIDPTPGQRSGAQCTFCEPVLSREENYCTRTSTVITRSRFMHLLSVLKSEKCFEGNTYSISKNGQIKNTRLAEQDDTWRSAALFRTMEARMQRCINRQGEYVEGD